MKRIAFLLLPITFSLLPIKAQTYPFQNPALSPTERANDLISRLTVEEKAGLMMNDSKAVGRLGIKPFQWWGESLHGFARSGHATVFPQCIGMAASFDNDLLYQVFTIASTEARANYNHDQSIGLYVTSHAVSLWTPNINIFRDPRWGRGQETYGEDPYLTGVMGTSVVNGLQGGPGKHDYYKCFACAKHFAIHSGPEPERHAMSVDDVAPRDLYETYLPAFETLVRKANVREVMCAYQSWDGEPCCSNNKLLETILRKEWGFDGIIVSDCGAIDDIWMPNAHHVVPTASKASAKGVGAGTDVNCGGTYKSIPEAIEKGELSEEKIDNSLRRIIEGRIRLGDFDHDKTAQWNSYGEDSLDTKQHQEVALKMARETMTLLQNDGILPLKKNEKIVVMGENAVDSTMLWGNYEGNTYHTVAILDGIESKIGKENVKYIPNVGLTADSYIDTSMFDQITNAKGEKGMSAKMWNNIEMQGEPVATKNYTGTIRYNLINDGIEDHAIITKGVNRENFSASFCGTFRPKKTQDYIVKISGDDGYRLIINGDTIVNDWTDHSTRGVDKKITFEAGKDYVLKADYFQGLEDASFSFDIVTRRVMDTDKVAMKEIGDAKTVVFVGGISPHLEGEEMNVPVEGFKGGDRVTIELPAFQRNLLRKIHDAGKRIVFVNCSGSAIALEPETRSCNAILQAWYAGERGGEAVADVLFGDYCPGGKLPVTFYRNDAQLPDFKDYSMKGRTYRYMKETPLFPFGYGLSYTTFEVGKAKLQDGKLTVSVKNTGKMAGDEVVQMYIKAQADVEGPVKALRGFKRVHLAPGETKTVTIDADKEKFQYFDLETNTMRAVPGKYTVFYGTSSADKDLKSFEYTLK